MTRPLPACLAQFGTHPRLPEPPVMTVPETREWLIIHGFCVRAIAKRLPASEVLGAAEELRIAIRSAQ